MPLPAHGITINFCRNSHCHQLGIPPDPFDGQRVSAVNSITNFGSGKVGGSEDESSFHCGACGVSSIIKNNRAVVEEYRRLRRLQIDRPDTISCQNETCRNHRLSHKRYPDRHRRFGKIGAINQRFARKSCGSTFTVGNPTRNQKTSHLNGQVLRLLVIGMALSKIAEITGLGPSDVYRKIDFIYGCIRRFTAERERDLRHADWKAQGTTFTTDSQTLTLNWPNRKTRASVEVQHLCTAHARSGYIVLGNLQLDPSADMQEIEHAMALCQDEQYDRCFRIHGRLWFASEFKADVSPST